MTKPASNHQDVANTETAAPSGVRAMRSELRRADILKASAGVLAQGYADYSLRKVATAAGVRINTVQHHFGDLEALVFATVEYMLGHFMPRMLQLTAGQYGSAKDDLLVFLDESWVAIRDAEFRTFTIELWAMGLHRPSVGQLVRQLYADYRHSVSAIVKRVNPDLSGNDLDAVTMLICSWTEGALVTAHWCDTGTPPLSFVGLRMKTACLALIGVTDESEQR